MAAGITKKIAEGIAAASVAAVACAGIAFAASGPNANATATQPTLLPEVFYDGDGDRYRMDAGGTVYEYDRGRWEAELDLKIVDGQVYEFENGTVYEYDDGAWEAEYDTKVENCVVYEYDEPYDDFDDDDDYDNDHDDDDDDDDD